MATAPQGGRSSSSLNKGWQELCERIKKSAAITKNNWKYSANEEKIWQSMKCMQLIWKKPTNTGKQTTTKNSQIGMRRSEDWRGTRRMKDTSLISSSPSSMVTTSCMSLPPISSTTGYTAWAPPALASPSTGMNCSHLNTSQLTKKGNFPTGSSTLLPMTPITLPCTITPGPRKTGESQLSSSSTMTCTLKLLPWLQSKGAWLLPLKLPKYSWTKASGSCSGPMPTSNTSSSTPSIMAPTSTQSQPGSSLPFLVAHATVWLNANQRVMSQGSLCKGKRTAGSRE